MLRFLKTIAPSIKRNYLQKQCLHTFQLLTISTKWNKRFLLPSHLTRCLESTFTASVDDTKKFPILSNQHKQLYSESIVNILKNLNPETVKEDASDMLLLQSCGRRLVDQNLTSRSELCDEVWKKLEECKIDFCVDHYNIYLQNCVDNRKNIDFRQFLNAMKCEPDENTFRLLLECSCEFGDIKQTTEILQEMKNRNYRADNKIFNTVILGYAANGGLTKAKEVFKTMRQAHLELTPGIYFNLLRGLALYGNKEEFVTCLNTYYFNLQESNYLELLLALALKGNYLWLEEVLKILGPLDMSNQDIQQLSLLCKQLVYLKLPEAAFYYYKTFVKSVEHEQEDYAVFLLKEMLISEAPIEKLLQVIDDLKASDLNSAGLEKVTEAALRLQYTEVAWKLLERFSTLKQHYFWPILIQSSLKYGEIGLFSTIKKMIEWNVKPDQETLEVYFIPYCSLNDPKDLYNRIQSLGFTNRELFSPFLKFFLKMRDLPISLELLKTNEITKVPVEQFLPPLARTWVYTKNNEGVLEVLQRLDKICYRPYDYFGVFLSRILRSCQTLLNHQHFLNFVKVMQTKQITISSANSESVLNILQNSKHQYADVTVEIEKLVKAISRSSLNEDNSVIPHPRNMSLEDLESHLIELQHKGMETRGCLRRLIQQHCNLGNEDRVKELRQQFLDANYVETPGMRSSLLYLYILKDNLTEALNVYEVLKDSKFLVDEFKIIELSTLLVKNKQFKFALNILNEETKKRKKVIGGQALERNCWRLLESSKDYNEMLELFKFLIKNGYCTPTNFILGPLVKFHLNKKNLKEAVKVFTNCANKYKCTPQNLELLCQIVELKDKELLQKVYDGMVHVHGNDGAFVAFIAALAQNGKVNGLRKILLERKSPLNNLLTARCERWVYENKLEPLKTLAAAAYELPSNIFDISIVYTSIMKLLGNNNDCDAAVEFYRDLLEKDEIVPQSVVDELLLLTSRCKYKLPDIK